MCGSETALRANRASPTVSFGAQVCFLFTFFPTAPIAGCTGNANREQQMWADRTDLSPTLATPDSQWRIAIPIQHRPALRQAL